MENVKEFGAIESEPEDASANCRNKSGYPIVRNHQRWNKQLKAEWTRDSLASHSKESVMVSEPAFYTIGNSEWILI
jgi:hypothetical protein